MLVKAVIDLDYLHNIDKHDNSYMVSAIVGDKIKKMILESVDRLAEDPEFQELVCKIRALAIKTTLENLGGTFDEPDEF